MSRAASEAAADRLRSMITSGELQPGDRLPVERALAADLGVSRSTVREAIRSLLSVGLVQARQGSGTYVTDLTAETLASPLQFALERNPGQLARLFEVRSMLEIGAAELAAQHATKRDTTRLRRLNEQIGTKREPAAMLAADWRFHSALHAVSRNELLPLLLDSIAHLGRGVRLRGIASEGIRQASYEQHAVIVEAVVAADPPGAGAAMRAHLVYVRDVLSTLLSEGGAAASTSASASPVSSS